MNNQDELLERAIRRDRAIRASGNAPGPFVESQIIELIIQQNYYSQVVREWILAVSATENMRVSEGLIEAIGQLLGIGYIADAVDVFSSMLQIELGDGGFEHRHYVFSNHRHKIESILNNAGLVDANSNIWGNFLVRLQSQMFRDAYFSALRRSGEAPSGTPPNRKQKDDSFHYEFYRSTYANRYDWWIIAKAIEVGLAKCIENTDSKAFLCVADDLIASEWGLAICQPLVALYDHINAKSHRSWQHDVAIQILQLPVVESSYAAFCWRRLVRNELSSVLAPEECNAFLTVIRASQPNARVRVNELNDLKGKVTLTSAEEAEIASAKSEEMLFPPRDRRESLEQVIQTSFSNGSPADRVIANWPFLEDHELLKTLVESEGTSAKSTRELCYNTLFARVEALRKISTREEIDSPTWFGDFLGWCTPVIADLKSWYLTTDAADNRSEIGPIEYAQLLHQHAPWWEARVVAAINHLTPSVPMEHLSIQLEDAYWTSDDPIACSLKYLDEVLATRSGSELDPYQAAFVRAVVIAWESWPKYTQWLTTALIREYFWATFADLNNLLIRSLADEVSSRNIEFSLGHLLRFGRPGITPLMKSIVRRIDVLSDPNEIAHLIGEVVGNAVVRCVGDRDTQAELNEITAFYDEICAHRSLGGDVRLQLVTSIVASAEAYLRSKKDQLQTSHEKVWDRVVTWGLSEWLELGGGTRFDLPTLPITGIIEMRWTAEQKLRLLESSTQVLMRIINESDVGGFYHSHREFEKLSRTYSTTSLMFSEDTLIQLCKASASRVAQWKRDGKTTNDYAYWLSVEGDDTYKLILLTIDHALNRDRIRRELAPVVDCLADVGLRDIASQLRTKLRRIG